MTDRISLVSATVLAAIAALVAPTLHAAVSPSDDEPGPVGHVEPAVPANPDGVEVKLSMDRSAVAAGRVEERFLTLDLTMPEVPGDTRRPLDLAVVIDTSGSMSGDKIAAARRATHHLVDALEPGDRFSLVTFESRANLLVAPTLAADPSYLHTRVAALTDGGGTNLYAGLDLGLNQLGADGRIPRLILLSDGQTNEGIVDPVEIARRAGLAFEHGAGVSTVGLGLDFNEDLLFDVSKAGGGSYHFVDDASSLHTVFAEEIDRSAALAGRQGFVDLELGQGVEGIEVLGWAAEQRGTSWRISLGDLPAQAHRRIVMRVRVSAGDEGAFEAARATVHWLDPQERPQIARAASTVEVTTSLARAESSVVPEVEGIANYMYANTLSMRSAKAYAAGDAEEAERFLDQSRGALEVAATRKVGSAKKRLDALETQSVNQRTYAPSSAAGKLSTKEMKQLSAMGYVE